MSDHFDDYVSTEKTGLKGEFKLCCSVPFAAASLKTKQFTSWPNNGRSSVQFCFLGTRSLKGPCLNGTWCLYPSQQNFLTCSTKPQLFKACGLLGLLSRDSAYLDDASCKQCSALRPSAAFIKPASSLKATPQLYKAA